MTADSNSGLAEIPDAEARLYAALSALFDARAGERIKAAWEAGWLADEDFVALVDLLELAPDV